MTIVNQGPEYVRILNEYVAALMGWGSAAEAQASMTRAFFNAPPLLPRKPVGEVVTIAVAVDAARLRYRWGGVVRGCP